MTFPLKFNRKCIILHNNKENKSEPFLQIFLSFSAGSGNIMQTCFKIHVKPSEHLSWQPAARISMQITLRTQNIAQDVVAFDLMFKVQVPYFFILFFFLRQRNWHRTLWRVVSLKFPSYDNFDRWPSRDCVRNSDRKPFGHYKIKK